MRRVDSKMKLIGRIIMALLSSAGVYFMYIYVPDYLLTTYGTTPLAYGGVLVEITDWTQLVFYVKSLGFMVLGVNFAHKMAHDKSKIKPFWKLIQVVMKIIYLGAFIFVDFTTIDVSLALFTESSLSLTIDIEILFWGMMGAVIFDIALTVLDFLIAFIPEKEQSDTGGTQNSDTTYKVTAEDF